MDEEKKEQTITVEAYKKHKRVVTIVTIIGMFIAFGCGYMLSVSMTPQAKCKDEPQKEDKEEVENKVYPVRDTFAVNLMTGYIYVVNNGELYYLEPEVLDNGERYFLLTHSGCLADNTTDYCKGNPVYGKTAVKVSGEAKVARVKTYNTKGATDESFSVYAILEDGSVYLIDKTTATKVEELANVDDMLGQNDGVIDVLLKDGTHKNY